MAASLAVPFKQSCIPELRCVTVSLRDDVAGMLTYFDDIHRHGQLEKLKISGDVAVRNNGNVPRLADLRQWLTMSTSAKFTLEMNLTLMDSNVQNFKSLLAEYQRVMGKAQTKCYRSLKVLYPKMSLLQPVEWDDDDSSDQSINEDLDDPIDASDTEVRRSSISHISSFDIYSSSLPNWIV